MHLRTLCECRDKDISKWQMIALISAVHVVTKAPDVLPSPPLMGSLINSSSPDLPRRNNISFTNRCDQPDLF